MIQHQMPFLYPTLLLLRQPTKHLPKMRSQLPIQCLKTPSALFMRFLITAITVFMQVAGWVIIFLGAFLAGFATLPELYLVATHQVAPGDLLVSDSLAMAQPEYLRAFAIEAGVIFLGFLINSWAKKWRQRSAHSSSQN
jgi:hypothetical protein